MGSPRQAAAAVTIINTLKRRRSDPWPLTLEERDYLIARVLAMTNAEVREQFKKWNEETGFDRHASDATPQQRALIGRLERIAFGGIRTTYRTKLKYSEASELIEELQKQRNAMRGAG